jgi:hypothetical protein
VPDLQTVLTHLIRLRNTAEAEARMAAASALQQQIIAHETLARLRDEQDQLRQAGDTAAADTLAPQVDYWTRQIDPAVLDGLDDDQAQPTPAGPAGPVVDEQAEQARTRRSR